MSRSVLDLQSATKFLASLSAEQKCRMLARLCHFLTIIGRDTYGSNDNVKDVERLRTLNEIQHRITGVMLNVLVNGDDSQLTDGSLAAIFFRRRDDSALADLLAFAFEQSTNRESKG